MQQQQQQPEELRSSSDLIWVRIPVSALEPLDTSTTVSDDEGEDKAKGDRAGKEASHHHSSHLAPPNASTPTSDGEQNTKKNTSFLRRLSDSVTGKKYSENPAHKKTVRIVPMTREEYDMYWARDEATGKYIGTAPEGSGREWYARKLKSYGRKGRNEGFWDTGLMNAGVV